MTDEREGPSRAEPLAAADLLPALYAELRGLAAALTARLPPGQTLQPTALVHEAYLRLTDKSDARLRDAATGRLLVSVPSTGRGGEDRRRGLLYGRPGCRSGGCGLEPVAGLTTPSHTRAERRK